MISVKKEKIMLTDTSFNYTEQSMQVLEGLEAVRKRPAMYIGSTDSKGLHHLIYEILDNAVDEALSGYGEKIKVTIHQDDSISVEDEEIGRASCRERGKMGEGAGGREETDS